MAKGIPIPDDWLESDGFALVTFCIPNSRQWRGIAVGMVENYSYGRFWLRSSGVITDAQAVGREVFETMSICKLDEILAALQSMAVSLSTSQGGCGCTSGPGLVTDNGNTYFGSQEPLSEPTSFGQPGDEWATEAEYLDFKCNIANALIDGLIATLSSMSGLTLIGITAGSVVIGVSIVAGLFVVPPMAILIALIATGIAFGVFSTLATAIDGRKEQMICDLYLSTDATIAYDVIKDAIEQEAGTLGWIATQIGLLSDFIMQLVAIDAVNKLFVLLDLPTGYDGEFDCSACQCEEGFRSGTGDLSGGTLTSTVAGATQEIFFHFNQTRNITLSNLTGWTAYSSPSDSFGASSSICNPSVPPLAWDVYSSDTNPFSPSWTITAGTVRIFSTTAFTVDLLLN